MKQKARQDQGPIFRPAAARAPRPAVVGDGSHGRTEALTRLLDVTVAGSSLVILAPFMVVIAGVIRLTSPGPALFRQTRIGIHKQPFVMLKFRTMRVGSDHAIHQEFVRRELSGEDPRRPGGRGLFKLEQDYRVTRVGRLLRSSSLDELPQLINVLRGEMAMVGPRPALSWELELYQPHHHERFRVKPGITGLWQVSGRSRLPMTTALDLDTEYVRRRSLALDLRILVRTVPAVLGLETA